MYTPNESQKIIVDAVKSFAEQNIKPHIMEWDEEQHFPVALFHKLGE
ncbi:MAG: acyl-CoA dehydrogenase family protein, partial [Weeksellaceae bacterium]